MSYRSFLYTSADDCLSSAAVCDRLLPLSSALLLPSLPLWCSALPTTVSAVGLIVGGAEHVRVAFSRSFDRKEHANDEANIGAAWAAATAKNPRIFDGSDA